MLRKPVYIKWKWQLNASAEELWPYITNTNRLFKDIGEPSIQRTDISPTIEPGFMQLSYNRLNRYDVWEEEPYQWEYPFHLGFVRHYKSGAYKNIRVQITLTPNDRGTTFQIECTLTPRLPLMAAISTLNFKFLIKHRIKKSVLQYDNMAVQGAKPYQLQTKNKLLRGGKKRLNQILEQLHNSDVNGKILDLLVEYITTADSLGLNRINPFELAEHWDIPDQAVLKVFIHAAKTGLLTFNWDLYCPQCRTIQYSVNTLSQISDSLYCRDCDNNFNVSFDKTIQLSFRPHPLIHKINDKQYCLQDPQTKPHIYIRQYLQPKEKRYLKTKLPPGKYILHSNQTKGKAYISVKKDSTDTVHIILKDEGFNGEKVTISSTPNLSFENKTDSPQIFTLERMEWVNKGVSAAKATSSQLFRNLFADEVLRKGEKISVDSLTLMFTDLYDSTGIYKQEGENQAVAQMIDHFEILQEAIANHGGAIVKTIGDSVMAVFCNPEDALEAYLKAQMMLSKDERFCDQLQLKAGIHQGNCMAVNLNSRIDYFGSTINIASRLVDLASENEVIMSADTLAESTLANILDNSEYSHTLQKSKTRLKGFNTKHFAIQKVKIETTSLRLAISNAAS